MIYIWSLKLKYFEGVTYSIERIEDYPDANPSEAVEPGIQTLLQKGVVFQSVNLITINEFSQGRSSVPNPLEFLT